MSEFISNSLGGLIMLFIWAMYLCYLLIAKNVPRWHQQTFRVMGWVMAVAVLVHLFKVWY